MADLTAVDMKRQARRVQHILILQRTRQILLHSTKMLSTKRQSTNFKGDRFCRFWHNFFTIFETTPVIWGGFLL
jgi:hypothetical protein